VKHWASLLGPRGIRVNAIAPLIIETDMSKFTNTEAGRNLAFNMQSLRRIAKPDVVADVIALLVSDGARWMTEASIAVNDRSKL
jgi:NAD(P)-dependent dehydrogenase (short-subunit alcohol dehydrogenase family)